MQDQAIATRAQPVPATRPGGRSWRREACTLVLAEILRQACRDNRWRQYKVDEDILERIRRWTQEAKTWVVHDPSKPMIEALTEADWTKSSARAWNRIYGRLIKIVREELVRDPSTSMVHIVGALLVPITDMAASVPADRRRPWSYLDQAVAALYRRVDPDFSSPDSERAQEIGERLRDILFEKEGA